MGLESLLLTFGFCSRILRESRNFL